MMRFAPIMKTYFGVWAISLALMIFYRDNPWIFLLLWPFFTMVVVFFAYLTNDPSIFGKDINTGKINRGYFVLFLPFFLVSWGCWYLVSKRSDEPVYSNVDDNVYLGRYDPNGASIPHSKEVLILDFTCEFSEPKILVEKATYKCFPVLDGFYPSNPADYEDALIAVYNWPGPIYLHCAQGHGRSGAFAAVLLAMRTGSSSLEEALHRLKGIRPGVGLEAKQRSNAEDSLTNWRSKNMSYV